MDRAIVTDMVEDYWRAFIPAAQSGDAEAALAVGQRFEARVAETASALPPLEAAAFNQFVDAERERLMAEYQRNPVALKRRLNLDLGVDARPARRQSSGLGDYAVKTAVRATVWDTIGAIFRAFR